MTGFSLLKLISCPSVQYCHSATVTTFKTFIWLFMWLSSVGNHCPSLLDGISDYLFHKDIGIEKQFENRK